MRSALLLAVAACAAPMQDPPGFERVVLEVPEGTPAALVAADVDGDGHTDLVASAGSLWVFRADGRGGFLAPVSVAAGANPAGLAAADFDADGRVDLAVANHETDHVTVLLGRGDGSFEAAPDSPLRPGLSPHPHAVVAGDVDGDGHADLLVDDRDGRAMLLLSGRGDGRFDAPRTIAVGGDPYREPWLGDLDGDGRLDLVTPNATALSVLIGRGDGTFTEAAASPVPAPRPFAVTAADVNGDGILDLASVGGEGGRGVSVFPGSADGSYRPAPYSPIGGVEGPGRLVAGDLDGDGYDDLVAGGWPDSSVLLLWGGPDVPEPERLATPAHPWSLAVADFDADGRLDIAAAAEEAGRIVVFLNRGG